MKKTKHKKNIYLLIIVIFIFSILFLTFIKKTKNNKQLIDNTKEESVHSKFYNPNISIDDIILYFNEIAFGAEYIHEGNPYKIQKWNEPIYYIINGNYTNDDFITLTNFINWLNTIDGFPGIYETQNEKEANLKIYFCDQNTMLSIMGKEFNDLDGAVTFWYENDIIYDAIICYRTDLNQYLRNSVILEEIYNGLGFIKDTTLREDSIIYSEFSQPQKLTEIDEILLKILYSKELKNGMNADECEKVIRKLYY